MDGNGRWALQQGIPRIEGHREGAKSVREIVRAAREIGVKALTLYAFSSQNWARPAEEVQALMGLLRDYIVDERPEIIDNSISLRAIGHLDRLPEMVREPLFQLIKDSAANDQMVLTLALSYGGRESLADAARRIAKKVLSGDLSVDQVDINSLNSELPTKDLPPLDLLIRSSGELRLSNFMLWECAYAELYFTETLWPEFRRKEFTHAIESFGSRERRFGNITTQQHPESDLAEPVMPCGVKKE